MSRQALEQWGPEIWVADGPDVSFFSFPYPTRMALVRLTDGGLWVWSPIALTEGLAEAVAALGPVRHLVAPNKLHHLFLAEWAERWPEARLHAAAGLARRRKDLHFDGELGDTAPPEWRGQIDQVVFRGSFALAEVLFFHRASRTLLVTDLVQKLEPERFSPFQRLVMRLDGLLGPDGSAPRELRLTFWRRKAARTAARTALAWNPESLLIAHGRSLPSGGRAAFARALRWLGP